MCFSGMNFGKHISAIMFFRFFYVHIFSNIIFKKPVNIEYRHKNPQQNVNKWNPAMNKKDYIP